MPEALGLRLGPCSLPPHKDTTLNGRALGWGATPLSVGKGEHRWRIGVDPTHHGAELASQHSASIDVDRLGLQLYVVTDAGVFFGTAVPGRSIPDTGRLSR